MQSLGGGSSSGSSNYGSLSTVSKVETGFAEQDYIGLSEVSSYSTIKQVGKSDLGLKDAELELGLSLVSSGCGEKNGRAGALQEEYSRVQLKGSGGNQGTWGGWVPQERAARIFTAKDFPPVVSWAVAGTKRAHTESMAGDAVQEVSSVPSSQVVGWPPIRASRINSLVNQTRVSADDNIENNRNYEDKDGKNNKNMQEKGGQVQGNSLFVKVNMDGIPIGRKVDLNAHVCYQTLAQALEDMFQRPHAPNIRQSGAQSGMEKEHGVIVEVKSSELLDGSSEFVLTYEDKEGDWMLVGDVPWRMFLSTVKRLRIMRTSEANGLGPRFQDKGNRQRSKPV